MNEQKEIGNALHDQGAKIGFLIDNLDLPTPLKEILFQYAQELITNPEKLLAYSEKLEIIYLEQKIIEQDSKYISDIKKIEDDTTEKILNIIKK